MKRILICLFSFGFLFASCAKEAFKDDSSSPVKGRTVVSVALDADAKTHLGPASEEGVRKVFWSNKDRININGVASEELKNVQEGSVAAEFEFQALLDYPYNVVYPASNYKSASTITLPATQAWKSGTFADNVSTAIGYVATSSGSLALKNVNSIIKLKIVKGSSDAKLAYVRFTGGGGEQVSGDFTVDFQKGTITGASSTSASKSVTVSGIDQSLSGTATEVMICVPAGTYNQFTVRLVDDKNHFMDMTKGSSVTLTPGQIYSMPQLAFNPQGTEINLWTADDYIQFVNDFNTGKYGTKDADVTVNVCDDLDFSGKTFKTMGNTNYEFSGTWNGNGKLMKNITATDVSMFYLPANAVIKNIVIDASCSFTRTASAGGHWGIISRAIDSGSISDCDINCNWNMDYGDGGFTYGTFCGRLGGKMTNCHMNGSLIYNRTVTTKVTSYLWIGGIVGQVSTNGEMTDCSTTGDVIFNEPAAGSRPTCATADKYFCVGGLVGKNIGKVTDCRMTGNFEYSDCPRDAFVGGVIGNSEAGTIENCAMEGNVKAFQTAANSTDYARFFVGGVIGRVAGNTVVKNLSTKSGTTVEFGSAVLNLAAGGVIGSVLGSPVIDGCVNNMKMTQKNYATFKAQYGGIIGAYSAGTLSNLENKADISVSLFNTASDSYLGCGGVLGYIAASVSGTITSGKSSIHNSGKLFCDAPDSCTGFGAAAFGGVVGIQNGGDITGVTNSGMIHFSMNSHKSTTAPIKKIYAGGIVGNICATCALSSSNNSGQIKMESYPARTSYRMAALGGIVGIVTPLNNLTNGVADVSVKNCTFSNTIYSTNNNLECPAWNFASGKFEGGIVGGAKGTSASYTIIENCKVETSSGNQYCAYGYMGGIIGGSMYVDIRNCTVKTTLQGYKDQEVSRAIYLSGIAGYARFTNVSGCRLDNVYVNYCYAFAGLIYQANGAGQTFENNSVDVTVTSPNVTSCYMLATKTAAETVVQNNGVKGSINGTVVTGDNVKYCEGTFTCDPAKPNYVITE